MTIEELQKELARHGLAKLQIEAKGGYFNVRGGGRRMAGADLQSALWALLGTLPAPEVKP